MATTPAVGSTVKAGNTVNTVVSNNSPVGTLYASGSNVPAATTTTPAVTNTPVSSAGGSSSSSNSASSSSSSSSGGTNSTLPGASGNTTTTTANGSYTTNSSGQVVATTGSSPYAIGTTIPTGSGADTNMTTATQSLLPANVGSEESFYSSVYSQLQPVIDAINQAEGTAETQANIAAQQATSAQNFSSNAQGMAGSSEADSQAAQITQTKDAAIQAAQSAQATAIANVVQFAVPQAYTEYQSAITQNDTNSQAYIQQQQTNLSNALAGLASSGVSLSSIQSSNPQEYNTLLQYAGGDPNVLSELYIQAATKNNTLLNSGQPLSQNGNQFIYGVSTIGADGKPTLSTQTLTLPFSPTAQTAGWVMSKTGTNNSVYYDPNNAGNSIIYSVNPFTGQTTITGTGTGLQALAEQGITPGTQASSSGSGTNSSSGTNTTGTGTNTGSSDINPITGLNTTEYGALAGVQGFNPTGNMIDMGAFNYIKNYLSSGGTISSSGMGGLAKYGAMNEIQSRAEQIYSDATGQNLPSAAELTNNQNLINTNSNLLNQLKVQEGTISKNFNLNLSNLTANNVNQSAPVINDIVNYLANASGSTSVAQYLSQNETLQNELASLLSVKNASGTTVADKLSSSNVLPAGASVAQAQTILNTLMTEANNQASVIGATNAQLYSQVDPLGLDPENPINAPGAKELTAVGFTNNYNGTFTDSSGTPGYTVQGNELYDANGNPVASLSQ